MQSDVFSRPTMPPQVEAALAYLSFARSIFGGSSWDGSPNFNASDLNQHEQRVYDDALSLLSKYFRGELVLDHAIPGNPKRNGDDGQSLIPTVN